MSHHAIGCLNEKSLHKTLKSLYSSESSVAEKEVEGYLIDLVNAENLIEIQTGNFGSIRKKFSVLLKKHSITLVYPIAKETTIKVYSPQGKLLHKRKSPKKQNLKHAAAELLYIPELLLKPHLRVEVILINQEEIRLDDGKGSWRRKGLSIVDRRLTSVIEKQFFEKPSDYAALLPKKLPEQFGNREISDALKKEGIQRSQCLKLAGQISYLLRKLGILKIIGKEGNRLLFELVL